MLCWNVFRLYAASITESPRHSSCGISLLLAYAVSTPSSSRERGSMSWHGKSHLSLNSQRPSITVWTERCDPNWSLSGEFNVLPPCLPPSRSPSLHLLRPFNTSQPSTSRVYIWNLSLWKVHRLTSGVLHKHRRAFKGHRKGIMTNSAHLVIVCSQ